MIGFLDAVENGIAHGWAVDSRSRQAPRIEIIANRSLVGLGLANKYRPDLLGEKSDGRAAFEISIDGAGPDVVMRANGRALPKSAGFSFSPRVESRKRSRFEHRLPSHQNAIDIFEGKWAAQIDPSLQGIDDLRISHLLKALGRNGRLDGLKILELGPLEGLHTVALERLGAEVTAIEANSNAYLKCLIVKEIAGLKNSKFLLGDFVEQLKSDGSRYDIVHCCGVLYHMADPITLIEKMASVADRCFVWSHVYDEARYFGPARKVCRDERFPHFDLWELDYGSSMAEDRFWGGNKPKAVWMRKPHMLETFRAFGLANVADFDGGETDSHAATCFAVWK